MGESLGCGLSLVSFIRYCGVLKSAENEQMTVGQVLKVRFPWFSRIHYRRDGGSMERFIPRHVDSPSNFYG